MGSINLPFDNLKTKKVLFAFDCDHTLVDVDSDIAITQILGEPLPNWVTSLHDGHYWTDYMNAVFLHLHQKGVQISKIADTLKNLPLVNGIPELFHILLSEHISTNSEFAIISDANDFGIGHVLSNIPSLNDKRPQLITNKSNIREDGCLQISPFENQTECSFCPKNLCKGTALTNLILKKGPFDLVVYVGDGRNDICPATQLTEKDAIFARKGYQLHQIIEQGHRDGKQVNVKAKVKLWNDGFQILEHLQSVQFS